MMTKLLTRLRTRRNHRAGKPVTAGVIGTGHFATAVLTQAASIPELRVPVVVDLDIHAAQRAYARAGIAQTDIVICENRKAAMRAWQQGKRLILTDAMLLMALPIDVVLESTGVPEAGARHALAAIDHGKHVVMVTKETDAVIGPILAARAARAGVVYTPADGDQHGLLIALVEWARGLGLEVLCGGKARDAEYVYDPANGVITCGRQILRPPTQAWRWFRPIMPGQSADYIAKRQAALSALPQVGGFDLVELAIAANATGLLPETPVTYCPPLHIAELPEVFCPVEDGGILTKRGVIDCVTCLRQPHEAGLGGGVFIVVACINAYSRQILHTKGLIPNHQGTAAVIYRPYHLCGVETPYSMIRAAAGQKTSRQLPKPRIDVIAQLRRTMSQGEVIGNDHSPDLLAMLQPMTPLGNSSPLPLHLANGNALHRQLSKGEQIPFDAVSEPVDSTLWQLRRAQDTFFFAVKE